ncbi:uncharacterized protein KGF55_005060 [Candida pseudojiufengensis]|uniref:uncharacterized protein n=1 Tax=Candida pseudojiufengensis TaxID=497109 RepID=UPI0022244D0C|nr:uncharacterized protein KGF55_005060 [Candida pseudojiufengensis]KAI5959828.1 hypothetical protein KGF55_005060 [Candida pseudojiufengensis]
MTSNSLIKKEEQPSDNKDQSSYYLINIFHQHYIILSITILLSLIIFHFRYKIIAFHDRWRTRRRIQQGYYNNLNFDEEDLIDDDDINSEFSLDNESFVNDINQGLNSSNFDVENSNYQDSRKGLSIRGKKYIKKLMETDKNLTFDDARLIYIQNELNKNGINNDGLPNDPKLVTF